MFLILSIYIKNLLNRSLPDCRGRCNIPGRFQSQYKSGFTSRQYPLPKIEYIFATLAAGQHFSKMDLRQAYLQMEVEEESKKLLTINTSQGLFHYHRLLFGVASNAAIWQRTIEQVLDGIQSWCILDDMVITGKTDGEHLQNL